MKKLSTKTLTIIISSAIVISSVVLAFRLLTKEPADLEWFDDSWSYRRAIYLDIDEQEWGTKKDILLEIDTARLVEEDKLAQDCRDMRFVDETQRETLGYWIEGGCDTPNTQVWIETELPREETFVIYFYYGNSVAVDMQKSWDGEFITLTNNDCKNDWRYNDELEGKTVLGSNEYGSLGGENSHNHMLFEIEEVSSCEIKTHAILSSNSRPCNVKEDNILNLLTSHSLNSAPFKDVNFCSSSNGLIAKDNIIFFEDEAPYDWESVEDFNSFIPRGKSNEDNIIKDELLHSHHALCMNADLSVSNGSERYLRLNKESGSSQSDSPSPTKNMNFINNSEDSIIPRDSIMIVTKLPPLGWRRYDKLDGLIPIGSLSDWGKENNNSKHTHNMDLSLSVERTSLDRLNNYETRSFCLPNNLNSSLELVSEDIYPPYVTVIFAQKEDDLIYGMKKRVGVEESREEVIARRESRESSQIERDLDDVKDLDPGDVLGGEQVAPTAPTELLTEGEVNPTKVLIKTPRFSAIFNDPNENDTSSYYRIQVNTNSDFTGTTMWDSTKTSMNTTNQGERSPNIIYGGDTLNMNNVTYYWRIKFWDQDDAESPWSSTAQFTTNADFIFIDGLRFDGIRFGYEPEQWPDSQGYIYKEGLFSHNWEEGYNNASPFQTFIRKENHLEIKWYDENMPYYTEIAAVSKNKINLSGYNQIIVNFRYLDDNALLSDSININNLSAVQGEYYLRFHVYWIYNSFLWHTDQLISLNISSDKNGSLEVYDVRNQKNYQVMSTFHPPNYNELRIEINSIQLF